MVSAFEVERVHVRASDTIDKAFYLRIAKARQPVILSGAILQESRWGAFQTWDPEYIQQRLPTVMAYKQHSREFITFHDSKPLESQLAAKRWEQFNTKHNVSTKRVLGSVAPEEYLYFSSDVTLLAERWPTIETELRDLILPMLVDASGAQVNLWLGRKGAYPPFTSFYYL